MKAADLLPKLSGVKKSGNGWDARCPAHDDHRASLSVADGDKGVVLHCHKGCTLEAVLGKLNLTKADLFNNAKPRHNGKPRIVATYAYTDESGKPLREVVRYEPKDFKQRTPDGKWKVTGVRHVPFHLPQLIKAVKEKRPVYIAEGEKDVLSLEAAGFCATCNDGGAGKWLPELARYFKGAEVVVVADKDEDDTGRKHARDVASKLQGTASSVKVIEAPDVKGKPVKDAHDYFAAGGDAADLDQLAQDAPPWDGENGQADGSIINELQSRAFNPNIEPPAFRPIYSLAGIPISTPGNLTTITSDVKTGKSAVIGAMAAAPMPHAHDADLLGFASGNKAEKALLWFDSEQSPDDFWHGVTRALRRAGLKKPPVWFHAYRLTGMGCERAWEAVTEAVRIGAEQHGGIHSVLLDGVADFVADVNDAEESNAFVSELHAIAIRHDCPIIGVIHFNPGSAKTRGHLGSQLERKAETNLALEKDDDESTVIYSTKNRRAGIPKDVGPRFHFDADAGMHVTIESRQMAKDTAAREELLCLARDVFEEHPSMRYSDIRATVKKLLTVTDRTAERKVALMKRLTVIKPSAAGLYVIAVKPSENGILPPAVTLPSNYRHAGCPTELPSYRHALICKGGRVDGDGEVKSTSRE